METEIAKIELGNWEWKKKEGGQSDSPQCWHQAGLHFSSLLPLRCELLECRDGAFYTHSSHQPQAQAQTKHLMNAQ